MLGHVNLDGFTSLCHVTGRRFCNPRRRHGTGAAQVSTGWHRVGTPASTALSQVTANCFNSSRGSRKLLPKLLGAQNASRIPKRSRKTTLIMRVSAHPWSLSSRVLRTGFRRGLATWPRVTKTADLSFSSGRSPSCTWTTITLWPQRLTSFFCLIIPWTGCPPTNNRPFSERP